jgi:hypothetical protein
MRLKFNSEQEYIESVIKDERFPDKIFYCIMGEKAKNQHFRVDKDEVICEYKNSKGQDMQFYGYFISPKEYIPYLVFGSRFKKILNN